MKYRNVGKAGIKVSEIALGSWMTDLRGDCTGGHCKRNHKTGI